MGDSKGREGKVGGKKKERGGRGRGKGGKGKGGEVKEGEKEVRKRGGREEKEVKKGGEGVKRGKG